MGSRVRPAAFVLLALSGVAGAVLWGLVGPAGRGGAVPVVGTDDDGGSTTEAPAAASEDEGAEPARAGAPARHGRRVLEGRVIGPGGVGVAGARVDLLASPGAPEDAEARHGVRTGPDGGFLLDDVPALAWRVRARHPDYMDGAVTVRPGSASLTIPLSPALVAWFRAVGPDGRPPEGVRATAASGAFRREQALTAPTEEDPPPPERGLLGPLRVPADTGAEVVFEVRVPGFEPWSIEDDAPLRGGVRVYEVGLVRATDRGRARVRLRTDAGAPVRYERGRHGARLERRDDGAPPRPAAQREAEGDLLFEGIAPGRYRATVVARDRAPATADFEVRANEETAVEAVFGAEARARIRVLAPGGGLVRVRLTREDRPVTVFLDPPPTSAAERDAGVTSFVAGAEGAVVGGLAPGEYVVEVISPDLAPFGARFEARAGETREIEVRPSAR